MWFHDHDGTLYTTVGSTWDELWGQLPAETKEIQKKSKRKPKEIQKKSKRNPKEVVRADKESKDKRGRGVQCYYLVLHLKMQ